MKLDGVPAGTIDHEIQNYVWEIDINNVPDCFHETLGKVLAELHGIPKDNVVEAGLTVHTSEEVLQWQLLNLHWYLVLLNTRKWQSRHWKYLKQNKNKELQIFTNLH